MQIVTSTTANGILTSSASVPGRCYGSIAFGVGTRDEPVAHRGISHLILHLIETAMEPALIPADAALDEGALTFSASGTTAQVLRFFETLSDAVLALGSVSSFELSRAKRLLELEDPGSVASPGVDMRTFRYGLGELGRAGFGEPGASEIGKKDVSRWAATWLTAENAAVALTKPITASFDLDLPSGPKPFRGTAVARPGTPTLIASENAGIGASIVLPSTGAQELGTAVHLALRDRLRVEAGLAYSVDFDLTRVSDTESALTYSFEPALADIPEGVRALVHGLQDIADEGVSAAVLTLAVEHARLAAASDPESVAAHLRDANGAALRGFGTATREESIATASAFTSESVAAAVSAALPSLLVAFDGAADLAKVAMSLKLPIDPFDLLQESTEKTWKKAVKAGAPVWSGRKSAGAEGVEAIVAADAVLFREDDVVAAVRFDDLLIVGERPEGTLVLVDADGRWDAFHAGEWKRGKAFVKALRKALPAGTVVPFAAVGA